MAEGVLKVWLIIFAVFILYGVARMITAPSRSAQSLKNIERELQRRGDA